MHRESDLLSTSAHRHIKGLLESKPAGSAFRVSVDAGGCYGFQYHFNIDEAPGTDDHIFDQDGVRIVVDDVSLPFLEKVTIDFVEDLMGSYFNVNNPQASSSCGCGNSFSL